MNFDTTLNLAWLVLGIAALGSTVRSATRRPSPGPGKIYLHIVGVALIVAALFPFISATDDILRIEQLTAQQDGQHHSGRKSQNDDLIRLYETMENPLVCSTCEIVITVVFAWMVFTPVFRRSDRNIPLVAGRSPPTLTLA